MTKLWVVNSSTDQQKYVTSDRKVAEDVKTLLEDNTDNSQTEYFITGADLIDSLDQISKYNLLDAEKDEGDVLIYFYEESGEWFRTYMKEEHAENVIKSLPQYIRWEVKQED